jgi:hypothetical protein
MYFSFIPDIKYDEKPVKFPFSQSEYITAKNFFRRFKIDEDYFQYSVYFNKYAVTDSDRLDTISEKFYGSPFYDWVVALTNNIINAQFDWPVKEWQLRDLVENPDATHHYETIEVVNSEGTVVLQGGLQVDERFVNTPYKYVDTTTPNVIYTTRAGNNITNRVTNLDQATRENDAKREIFILKPIYLQSFVTEFREQNLYSESSNYISSTLKQTG